MPGWSSIVNRAAWAAAAAFVIFILPGRGPRVDPLDFRLMWSAAQAARALTLNDLYSETDNRLMNAYLRGYRRERPGLEGRLSPRWVRPTQATFTPALLSAFAIGSSGNLAADFWRFLWWSEVAFGAGCLALAASLGVPGVLALAVVWLATLPSWSWRMTLFLGNMGALLTGVFMMLVALLRARRRGALVAAGFGLALLGALKPTFLFPGALLFLTFLFSRRWDEARRLAAGGALAVAVAIVVPWLVLGPDVTWWGWASYVPGSVEADSRLRGGTFLAKMSEWAGAGDVSTRALRWFGAALNAAVFAFWIATSRRATMPAEVHGKDANTAAAGAVLYLLTGPVVHSHYFLQAIPAALVALRPRPGRGRTAAIRAALALGALFLIGGDRTLRRWELVTAGVNHSHATFVGVALLLVLLMAERVRRPHRFG